MFVARILYPVRVLGPGDRVGIWFAGCPRRCPGCSNPELWEFAERYRTTADMVLALVDKITGGRRPDGFTLSGGDPFAQPEALAGLLPRLREISPDILVYTGYTYAELSAFPELVRQTGVIIDGPYIEARNNGCPLRGSDNQTVRVIDGRLREKYDRYLETAANRIQNFTIRDGVISVGIHRPGYQQELRRALAKKGLKTNG